MKPDPDVLTEGWPWNKRVGVKIWTLAEIRKQVEARFVETGYRVNVDIIDAMASAHYLRWRALVLIEKGDDSVTLMHKSPYSILDSQSQILAKLAMRSGIQLVAREPENSKYPPRQRLID